MATATPAPTWLADDPVLRALDHAPVGERFTPEQEEELAEDLERIREGSATLVPHDEVQRELARMRR